MIEAQEDTPDDEIEPQGRMFFGGIWWNSSWGQILDLYDDHNYWRCDDDAIMENEDHEEEDPKEDPREGILKETVRMKAPLILIL